LVAALKRQTGREGRREKERRGKRKEKKTY